jgi:hypothetical protein
MNDEYSIVGTDAYGSHQVGAQKAVYGKTGGSFSLAAGKTNLGHLEGRGFMVDVARCFDTSSRFFKDLKLPSMDGLESLVSLVLNMSNFVRYFAHWHLIFIIFLRSELITYLKYPLANMQTTIWKITIFQVIAVIAVIAA